MAPSAGRIVHFYSTETDKVGYAHTGVAPAVITQVHSDAMVDLTVFRVGMDPIPIMGVMFSENETGGMRWFWPPRVGG